MVGIKILKKDELIGKIRDLAPMNRKTIFECKSHKKEQLGPDPR